MRIVRYLINASLVLILSFSGLRANEDGINLSLLDRAATAHQNSNHSVIGFGVTDNSISPQRMLQINKEPIETQCDSKIPGAFLYLKSTNTSQYVAASRACGLAQAFEVASRDSCHQVVMQSYHKTTEKLRTYPEQAKFMIAPELQKQLANVDTNNFVNLERIIDARRVVTSVALGYLSAFEVTIDFGSLEGFKAFQAAQEANSRQEVSSYRLDCNIPKPRMKGRIVEHGQLVGGVPVPDIWQLVVDESGVHVIGDNADRELQFDNISSLSRVYDIWTQAYDDWSSQNQRKKIKILGVVMVNSHPIENFDCYDNAIQGFCYKGQTLSLKSANNLVKQLKSQETLEQCRHRLIQDAPQKTSTIAKRGAIIGALVVALGVGIYFLFKKQWHHSKQRSHSTIKDRLRKAMQGSSIIGALGVYLPEPHPANEDSSPAKDQKITHNQGVLATDGHIAFILMELLKVLPMVFDPNPYPIFTESA